MLEEDVSKSNAEMDEQFIAEYQEASIEGNFDNFAEAWGMSLEDVHTRALELSQLDGFVPDDFTMDENTVIDKDTITAANDAYENTGKLDFNPEMDPEREAILNGMVGSTGKANAIKGMFSKLGNNLFASKALKANQKAKRGVEGEVVKGTSKTLKDSNLRPSIANKTADRYKSMADKVKKDNAVKTGTVAGAATAIGLSGNRNENGDFEKVDLYQPQGIEQPEEQPESKSEGNQFGYHKKEGQNFMTVNNDDAYWDTHEMGTGDAWSDADVKKVQQEVDWSNWF